MKRLLSLILVCTVLSLTLALPAMALYGGVYQYPPEEIYILLDEPEDWYYKAFYFCSLERIMTPTIIKTESTGIHDIECIHSMMFYGNREITRGEVSTVLSRFNGSYATIQESKYTTSVCDTFVDVPDGKWLTPAVNWAYENGITGGVGGSYFAPDRTITREEFAALMYRYTAYREVERDTTCDISSYTDSSDVSDFAADAMKWAVGCGLISGKPGGLLAPKDTITRGEVALIIYRYNDIVPHID